ncbi:MAG: ThuA domain-containing protein [Pseudomonadota bacterium]
MVWCHEYDGGRAFYSGMGHHANEQFADHILGGILYAAGQ